MITEEKEREKKLITQQRALFRALFSKTERATIFLNAVYVTLLSGDEFSYVLDYEISKAIGVKILEAVFTVFSSRGSHI